MERLSEAGGRTLMAAPREAERRLLAVGLDVGSTTSHAVFSELTLRLSGARPEIAERRIAHCSEIRLTPYLPDGGIDAAALSAFFRAQYAAVGLDPAAVGSGALILTGHAAEAGNARAIGAALAAWAGPLVALAAGDRLEALLAARGAGAVARSRREGLRLLHLDLGGGTSKLVRIACGEVEAVSACDVGARGVVLDPAGRVLRIAPRLARLAAEAGFWVGETAPPGAPDALAARLAEALLDAMAGGDAQNLARLPPLPPAPPPDLVTLSGGVAEFLHRRSGTDRGDLGRPLAEALRALLPRFAPLGQAMEGIRATAIGAAQHTLRLSGATVLVRAPGLLPLREVGVIAPRWPDEPEPGAIAAAIRAALPAEPGPLLLVHGFRGRASHARLEAAARGILAGLAPRLAAGAPLLLAGRSDVGRLLGRHLAEECGFAGPLVSLDGIAPDALDRLEIGRPLPGGAVPVTLRTLLFPDG